MMSGAMAVNTRETEQRLAATQNERALWALAHRLDATLAAKLLSQGSSPEDALVAINGILANAPAAPAPAAQTPTPQPQPGMTGAEWDAQLRGQPAPSGDPAPFSGYGPSYDAEFAAGAAAAKSILARVSLTR